MRSAVGALAVLLCVTARAQGDAATDIRYDVALDDLAAVGVSIELPARPDRFYMMTGGSGSDDGFAGYVRNLTLTCGSRAVALTRNGAEWHAAADGESGACRATYSVDLGFTRVPWGVGNEQAGYSDGRGTFVVSKAVLIETTLPGKRRVRLHSRPAWQVVTPWSPDENGTFGFERDEFLLDLLAFGDLRVSHANGANFRAHLVTFDESAASARDAAQLLQAVTNVYAGIFPGAPATDYLVVLIPGAQADGEAYAHGFASALVLPLDPQERIVWGDTIAHEIFHYWCGGLIHARDHAEMEWFTEGFTEYFANLALMRSGQVAATEFLQKVAISVGQYEYFLNSGLFRDVTIATAGQNKGANRFGVYSAGWVMAFVLDQDIRAASGGQRSLESLMRVLLERAEPLTTAMLLESVAEIGGEDARRRLQAAITTREPVAVAGYFARLGLKIAGEDYAGEYYLHVDTAAGTEALQRRKAWAGF
jgi:predicted metalloprotease with PDZ domain